MNKTPLKIAFTLCSNNYLSQALVLGNSLLRTNPDYKFHIGVVDERNDRINYETFSDFQFTFVEQIGLPQFDDLIARYNIIELNTSVKSSYFKYLFQRYPNCSHIHYFDPDIKLLHSLDKLDSYFGNYNILLTPHILQPITDDSLEPRENMFLNYGIYNLGYLGLKNDEESFRLLDWWENHTLGLGYMDVKNGYFVDQLWMNHVPLFFDGVKILREKGFNCAPWNLQERAILDANDELIVLDDKSILTFYHFSSFNPNQPERLSHSYNRNTFTQHPSFWAIYDTYRQELLQAGYNNYNKLSCGFIHKKELKKEPNKFHILPLIKRIGYLLLPPILTNIFKRFIF